MDRHVSAVEDDNVIDGVRTLNKTVKKGDDGDDFAKPADDLKGLSGLSAVAKRKISYQINKYRRAADGTESKQVTDKPFISGYDAFDVILPPYNLDYLSKLYELSAPHYAACNAKVANVVGLGYKFEETRKTKRALEDAADNEKKSKRMRTQLDQHREDLGELLESFNEDDTLTETLTKVWRDYEVTGNGYIEIGRKKDGTIGYIGHIPSKTIRIRRKRDGFIQISGFETQFFNNFGHPDDPNPLGQGKPNEVLHIKKYSPTSTYYGIPDIIAAKQAIAGNEFAARYNLDFFENMAVPRHVVILKGAKLGAQSETALLTFLETGLKGQNHRSLFIPLPGDTADNKVEFKIEKIMSDVQDASFNNYRKGNLADILMAHRVPITKISVSDGASLAVAKGADKTFKEEVCVPEQQVFNKKFNKIIRELTDAFEFKLNEMTLSDESEQSQIDDRDRKAGIKTANEIRVQRGLPTISGGDELFDLNGKQTGQNSTLTEETANRQRDTTRAANATDSRGAARAPKGEGRSEGTA